MFSFDSLKKYVSVLVGALLLCCVASLASASPELLKLLQQHHDSFSLPAVLTEEQAEDFVRHMPSDEVEGLLLKAPKKARVALLFETGVIRGRMSRNEAAKAAALLDSLPNKKYAVLYLARHETRLKALMDAVADGKQVIMGSMIYHAHIRDYSRLLILHVNLAPTLKKIRKGELKEHDNNGWKIFHNYEGLLAPQKRGYYREVRVATEGLKGAGPQRLVYGQGGEIFYTPDHYHTFYKLEEKI